MPTGKPFWPPPTCVIFFVPCEGIYQFDCHVRFGSKSDISATSVQRPNLQLLRSQLTEIKAQVLSDDERCWNTKGCDTVATLRPLATTPITPTTKHARIYRGMLPIYYGGTVKFCWHVRCWGSTAPCVRAAGPRGDLHQRRLG